MVNLPSELYTDIKNKATDSVDAVKQRINDATTPVAVTHSATHDGEKALYIVSIVREGEREVVDVFSEEDLDDLSGVESVDDLHDYARREFL